ncbi:Tetratricopeptide repeat protein [Planctomycetes bacterium Poly30]|uniref:Tetratricopeptide repeat protein n=1 Tax=Saltatorellus ferox TaxID=2528018 RepID=A0A518ERL2_9BACT|nr:Tetratricopeptide repeat protein [Planctomycetes bacterium Poly30]
MIQSLRRPCLPARSLARTLLLGALCFGASLGAASTLTSCSSSGPRKPGDDLGLTDKQKLGLFYENALRYYDLGDIDRAQVQARNGLEVDPGNEKFLLIFGRCNLLRGNAQDIQVAIDTFKRIRTKDDFKVQASWGAAVERLGMFYEEASEGIRSGDRSTDAADPMARADELHETAVKYWSEAHDRFQRSLELRSGEPEAINGLVRTSALLGRTQESIAHARSLVDAIQASQRLVANELDNTEITAASEERLFKNRASNAEFEVKTRLYIATALRREGDLSGAIDELDQIIALDPYLAQAHSQKAQLLFEAGDFVKARASITRFLEMRAPTSTVNDPDIKQAFELRERCDRNIVKPRQG